MSKTKLAADEKSPLLMFDDKTDKIRKYDNVSKVQKTMNIVSSECFVVNIFQFAYATKCDYLLYTIGLIGGFIRAVALPLVLVQLGSSFTVFMQHSVCYTINYLRSNNNISELF